MPATPPRRQAPTAGPAHRHPRRPLRGPAFPLLSAPGALRRSKRGPSASAWRGVILLLLVLALLLPACSTLPPAPTATLGGVDEATLVSGRLLFTRPPAAAADLPRDLLASDAAMDDFLHRVITRPHADERARLQALLRELRYAGRLEIDYAARDTHSASHTFHSGRGNCLSFTHLTIALTRGLGLSARYQLVDVPVLSEQAGDLLLQYRHVNALIVTRGGQKLEVDFNPDLGNRSYPRRIISDAHARALHYNNLAAESLQRGDMREAFARLRLAIETEAQAAAPWVNLGVLYRRAGVAAAAESAWLAALERAPRTTAARQNLLNLYRAQRQYAQAGLMQAELDRVQARNPYYHHERALRALHAGRARQALDPVLEALRLQPREAMFYATLAEVQWQLGERRAARLNLRRALKLSVDPALNATWEARLAELSPRA